jgi:hypothetical protein
MKQFVLSAVSSETGHSIVHFAGSRLKLRSAVQTIVKEQFEWGVLHFAF